MRIDMWWVYRSTCRQSKAMIGRVHDGFGTSTYPQRHYIRHIGVAREGIGIGRRAIEHESHGSADDDDRHFFPWPFKDRYLVKAVAEAGRDKRLAVKLCRANS